MDLAGQHVRQGFVNHSMSLQPAPAGKCFRLDPDQEVPGAAPGTRVACMPGAVIEHGDLRRRKGGLQPRLDPVN